MIRAAALLMMLGAACGIQGGQSDAGPPADARFLSDANVQPCSAEMDDCAALDFEVVCDLDRSRCVECISGDDCAAASSLGPTCNAAAGTCQCASDDECAENTNGGYCHPEVSACGCITDDECQGNRECKLEPYLGTGIRTCQVPST